MTVVISVTFSELYPEIKRHLSIIGKRQKDENGNTMFADITTSSREEPIFDLYMQTAAQNVVAEIEQFVSAYTETDSSITFQVMNKRWNDPSSPSFVPTFSSAFNKYLVFYTISEYLSMNFPELAKKYLALAIQKLKDIIRLVFFKAPPVAETETPDPSVSVQQILEFDAVYKRSHWQFQVPSASVIDVFEKWGNLTVSLIRNVQSVPTVITQTVLVKTSQQDFEKQLTWTPTASEIAAIKATLNNVFSLVFEDENMTALQEGDILRVSYYELNTNP